MGLNKAKGNMYSFITHTWNPVRGKCEFNCTYCYVDKWGRNTNPVHLDEADLNTNLGEGNYIFVCSGCDLFHDSVPWNWVEDIFSATEDYRGNSYLWHTKNPYEARAHYTKFGKRDTLCVTIESNRNYADVSKAPLPANRFGSLFEWEKPWMLTIEPIMDFDLDIFKTLILRNKPIQINIGADSGGNKLPEPPREKVEELIELLAPYTTIHLKKNLRRILPESRYYGNH